MSTENSAGGTTIERYQNGWRSGKPVEDPEKLKRWGYIGAKPSEYLVCTRKGEVDRKRSGQGMRIFKWPWLSVSIVPTTLQRIEFTADQVTRERVGVSVSGIAVYRIAEPLLAFRVLNFTYGEAASEKLASTLREMFIGAARRLIANLSLDECLTRRKEAIAGFLMEEIAPVVGGEGSPDDMTTRGWGVVIDTIEIQQVQIQSQQVFAHLQAPYRAEIAARAELAELERQRQLAERRAETERLSQEAQLESVRATRALKARTEAEATEVEAREAARRAEMTAAAARRNAELERDRTLHQIQIAEEQRRAKAAAEVAALEAERARAEAMHAQAELDVAHHRALEASKQAAEHERARAQADLSLELRRREAEVEDHKGQLEAQQQMRLAEIERLLVQGRVMRDLVAQGLPKIAEALSQSFGTVHYTHIGSGDGAGGPLQAVPAALAQLLALARSFGVELPAPPANDRGIPRT
jgi:regulator of protease activity HflC (stomatin/prohibitin superfamily)